MRLPQAFLRVELLLVGLWLLAMGWLGRDSFSPSAPTPAGLLDLGALPQEAGTRWMGIYIQGVKVGTATSATWTLPDGGLAMRERSAVRLNAFGRTQKITTTQLAEMDEDLTTRTFGYRFDGESGAFQAEGKRVAGGFSVRIRTGDGGWEEVTLVRPPILAGAVLKAMMRQGRSQGGLKPGQRFQVPFFDPATRAERTATGLLGERTAEGLWELRYQLAAAEATAIVDDDGEIIRDSGLLGMELRLEDRETALKSGWPEGQGPDLIALSAVPVDRPLNTPRKVRRLTVDIHAPEAVGRLLAATHGASWEGSTLKLDTPASIGTNPLPSREPGMESWLAPEPGIEVGDPAIRTQAGQILGEALDSREAARLLLLWVYRSVEKKSVVGVPSALTTLNSLQGDCNEHTALYVALARASGIPTKIAAGIVYTDHIDPRGAFYYHAWPEVRLGGAWVPVDPTFGDFPADATHIKLVEGGLDRQVDLLSAIGRMSILIREAS